VGRLADRARPVPERCRRDAEQARHLAGYLKYDHVDWLHLLWKANRLARTAEFRRLVVAIADRLERVELLDAADLRGLMAEREAVAA
jgi:hypothetical protein